MANKEEIAVRGFLIHITHYDPRWVERKPREKPFDLDIGLEVVDAMAEVGMNLLAIDCADGVRYKSHPELTRHYSVPMGHLKKLVARARKHGIEVVPKLNFSHSHINQHNHWFRPHNALFDNEEYWERAFELIDELIDVCRPERFFHVGMDEDHDRAYSQYIDAIATLHAGLTNRGLRPVIWHDACLAGGSVLIHAEKSMTAEKTIPRGVVEVVWDYGRPLPKVVRRLARRGFEVWGAPGRDPDLVRRWREALLRNGGKGMLLTCWAPCRPSNRKRLLNLIRVNGAIVSGADACLPRLAKPTGAPGGIL